MASQFNAESEKLQQLALTLSPITFKWNADEGLMTYYLHLARKPQKSVNEIDVSKLWKSADKFPSIVSQWLRVRVTGGSEAGKRKCNDSNHQFKD